MNLRFDLHFSYWIIAWCIVGIVLESKLLPFYGLILSILFHTTKLIINYHTLDRLTLISNVFVITIIKLVPILYIWKYFYNKIDLKKEIPMFLILLAIFVFWKYIINKDKPILSEFDIKVNKNTPIVSIVKEMV